MAQANEIQIKGLTSHLAFIDRILTQHQKDKAVALKIASAYILTLWFDPVDKEEASAIFLEGLNGKIKSWAKYKKVQDYLARWIFLKAAELDIPVHIHTGFGASEKIMFGSDAGAPTFFWIAAKNSRQALYKALSRIIEQNRIDEGKAVLIAEKIMRTNAIRIHAID